MDFATLLHLNTPRIACEVLDGEAVLIDFDRGTYYSAEGAGGLILERLAAGASAADLVAAVGASFSASSDSIREGVLVFLQQLRDEELVTEMESGAAANAQYLPSAQISKDAPLAEHDATSFLPPVLRKYTDLKDLLLLDPIHDTDAAGWPLSDGQQAPAADGM